MNTVKRMLTNKPVAGDELVWVDGRTVTFTGECEPFTTDRGETGEVLTWDSESSYVWAEMSVLTWNADTRQWGLFGEQVLPRQAHMRALIAKFS